MDFILRENYGFSSICLLISYCLEARSNKVLGECSLHSSCIQSNNQLCKNMNICFQWCKLITLRGSWIHDTVSCQNSICKASSYAFVLDLVKLPHMVRLWMYYKSWIGLSLAANFSKLSFAVLKKKITPKAQKGFSPI